MSYFFKKITAGRQLEAFSIQLVILAIWKKALDICHTQAASALEGSPGQGSAEFRRSLSKKQGSSLGKESRLLVNSHQPVDISSQVEREFLREVEYAEELAKVVEPGEFSTLKFSYWYWKGLIGLQFNCQPCS